MKTKISFVFALLLLANIVICAQPISTGKAIDAAVHFFAQETENSDVPLYAPAMGGNQMVTAKVLRYAERECMYVVSMPDSGWVLVSADERVAPILAVSYNGTFPAEEVMPPAMRDLFEDYANEIMFIQDGISDSQPHSEWEALENNTYQVQTFECGTGSDIYTPGDALLNRPDRGNVEWSQGQCNDDFYGSFCDNAYNKFCPDWHSPSCERTYVGCGAVAMGQIMWYWQWPHTAYIHKDIYEDGDPKGQIELHLYDWNLMANKLTKNSSPEEINEVAGFLRDCGYAIKTKYRSKGSFSNLINTKKALIDIFFYDDNIELKIRNYTNWEILLREEINAGRPVLYRGYSLKGGHAFVVDGYDKSNPNLFHINWGWGYTDDNYYRLNSLCPGENCFKTGHRALFGIKPAPDCAPYSTNGTKTLRYGTGGELSINTTVESGEFGVYYSGTEVRLQPGFHAKQGSTLHVAIQHFPCDGIAPQSLRAPKYHQQEEEEYTSEDVLPSAITFSPNPTNGLLNIQTDKAIQSVAVYQLDGQKVTEQTGNTVELYDVSAGIYILHVYFADGSVYIDKVIKAN